MASVSKDAKGYKLNFNHGGKRRVLRCRAVTTRKQWDHIASNVQSLLASHASGSPIEQQAAKWLRSLPDGGIYAYLCGLGLAPERARDRPFVEWVKSYYEQQAERVNASEGTKKVWGRALTHALRFFGKRLLSSITDADAQAFRVYLLSCAGRRDKQKLAEATVRKMCSVLSQACGEAIYAGVLGTNPFHRVPKAVGANPNDNEYIDMATVRRVMEATPSEEMRLLVGLSRWAGLRVPSETRGLRWDDVIWSERVLHVKSPKTAKQGKPTRRVSICADLFEMLTRAFADAPDHAVFLLPTMRLHSNPCTPLSRAIRAAGLTPWMNPFHNLRKACVTDAHRARMTLPDAAEMFGHTVSVMLKHYVRASREGHYIVTGMKPENGGDASGVFGCKTVVLPVVTHPAATSRTLSQRSQKTTSFLDESASSCDVLQKETTGCEEPVDSSDGPYWTRTSDLLRVMETR